MLYAIVAVLVIIVDQWIKYWVAGAIPLESTGEAFIPGILSLVNLHNDGAAFSFLAGGGARIYFIILTGAFTVAVIIALATRFISGRLARWCLVLVTAGGVSNCIDRVIYGYVQDMFKTEFINFPVFNLADVFITVFCVLFVIAILFERDRDDDEEDDELFADDDEDDDVPVRRSGKEERKARKAARRAARYEDDDEDDEEEEERPRRAQRKQAKNSQPPVDEEYEQYKAAKAAREKALAQERAQQQARQRQAAAAQQQAQQRAADPFAEWERATAQPAARPAQQSSVPQQPVQQRPAQQPAAARPAAKPASSSDEFSLDDILAEFK